MGIRNRNMRNAGKRSAASAVEFAVVAPLLFLLVLGIIELGRGYMLAHLMNDTARNGCRAGVVHGRSTGDVEKVVNSAVKAYGLKNTTTKILVNGVETDAVNAKTGDEIIVTVSVPVKDVTWLPGGKLLPFTLTGDYRLRRE